MDIGTLPRNMQCPGPLHKGERSNNCGQPMALKPVKDRKDGIT